jgi:hypothetical protein
VYLCCLLFPQVFFAKVPPTALANEVESLFGSFGKLAEVNLFRAWAGAKHSKVGTRLKRSLAHLSRCFLVRMLQ